MNYIKHELKYLCVLLLLLLTYAYCPAQSYRINQHWILGIHAGKTSYFGDLSVYDKNLGKKLSLESDRGFGLKVAKKINPLLAVNLSYLDGKFMGSNEELQYSFESEFYDLLVSLDVNIIHLLWPASESPFGFYTKTGAGWIDLKATKRDISTKIIETETGEIKLNGPSTSVVKPLFMVGVGASYTIKEAWMISMELSNRIPYTDLIDAHKGSTGVDDYYSYLSIGINYILNSSGSGSSSDKKDACEPNRFKRNRDNKRYNFR